MDADGVFYTSTKHQAKRSEDCSTIGILRNPAFLDQIAQALGKCYFQDLAYERGDVCVGDVLQERYGSYVCVP